jgi:RNA polymerase sigma factor (sigma-70 family)
VLRPDEREQLILRHLRLGRSCADALLRKFPRGARTLRADVYGEADLLVCEAVDRYLATRGATLESWIVTFVNWRLRDYLRSQGAAAEPLDSAREAGAAPRTEEGIDYRRRADALARAICGLEPRERRVVLRRLAGDKWRAIAQTERVSCAAACIAHRKALEKLKNLVRLSLLEAA